ncbi:hypothetical protein LSCM1_07431 [Leishmania martiniquensis]|uniref:Uncharacterized protein n=1 Tax=Leishmania martiniquensis TaxID=1580590 RepID=A0A836KUH5_9TRYP|nr:hypothetical protein LSCM1_07431 [Leishmania martiniquensis]
MAEPSRRPEATEGGRRSRHRRRLSPAHPVPSSPAASPESSINDATASAGRTRLSLRAGSKQSRKQRRALSTLPPRQSSEFGVATAMTPVTAIAAFSQHPHPPLLVPRDPIIVAQQVSRAARAVVADSALAAPVSTAIRLAEFSSANGSVGDPCVVAAVLSASAGGGPHAVYSAVGHGAQAKGMETAFRLGPPTVEPSHLLPPQQESEEDKQLSRRGLRLGAVPFYPAATASLGLAMAAAGGISGGDALRASLAVAIPSPQSFLGSYSMSPTRSPPQMQPNSSPLGESINDSRSSTGGLMSGQSAFTAESAAAAGTPWTLTVDPPSHSSPPSSVGRGETDGDGVSSTTPSVPPKSLDHRVATSASNGSSAEVHNVMVDRPATWRSALMVTNTATGALLSPVTVPTPSSSPTLLWSGSSGNGAQTRASKHGSGIRSLTAAASLGGTGHHSAVHSASTPDGDVVQEFPQAPYPAVSRTTEPHQPQHQHPMFGSRVLSESDLDRVRHNRVAVSDVVAKDEGTLVDTLFADVNMIEDDESEVDGEDTLNNRGGGGGGERWSMQLASSSVASSSGSPLAVSSPDARTPHSMNQQPQHRPGPVPAGARMLGKEAGGQVFGGGYWYPSGPWSGTEGPGRGSGGSAIGAGSHRGGGSDARFSLSAAATANIGSASVAAAWRGLSTPPQRHRAFSASCASVASTMSLIDPKQPQVDGAGYDMMGEDDEWEINSSAYADSLDEAQIQWIEEQLRATENPAGYF